MVKGGVDKKKRREGQTETWRSDYTMKKKKQESWIVVEHRWAVWWLVSCLKGHRPEKDRQWGLGRCGRFLCLCTFRQAWNEIIASSLQSNCAWFKNKCMSISESSNLQGERLIQEPRVQINDPFASIVQTPILQKPECIESNAQRLGSHILWNTSFHIFDNKKLCLINIWNCSTGVRHHFLILEVCSFRWHHQIVRDQPYMVVRGLTGVWELKGEGPCWKGLGLWPSGVAGEVLGRTRPTGWMAPGRV